MNFTFYDGYGDGYGDGDGDCDGDGAINSKLSIFNSVIINLSYWLLFISI